MASVAPWSFYGRSSAERRSSFRQTFIGARLNALHRVEGTGNSRAEDRGAPNAFYFFGPVDDHLILCHHVFYEIEQDGMYQAGNGFASWMAQLHHRSVSELLIP